MHQHLMQVRTRSTGQFTMRTSLLCHGPMRMTRVYRIFCNPELILMVRPLLISLCFPYMINKREAASVSSCVASQRQQSPMEMTCKSAEHHGCLFRPSSIDRRYVEVIQAPPSHAATCAVYANNEMVTCTARARLLLRLSHLLKFAEMESAWCLQCPPTRESVVFPGPSWWKETRYLCEQSHLLAFPCDLV
jgi:hypothetical protein